MLVVIAMGCSEQRVPLECDEGLGFSEIAAANEHVDLVPGCADGAGWCCEQPDWIELYNDGPALDIGEYSLGVTPDDPRRPLGDLAPELSYQVESQGWFVLVAVPYTPDDVACGVPVGFPYGFVGVDLDRDGGIVLELRGPRGDVCDQERFPDQHADFSYSNAGDDTWCFTPPTPGAENEPCL